MVVTISPSLRIIRALTSLRLCLDPGRKWDISKRFKDFLKFESKLIRNFNDDALAGLSVCVWCYLRAPASCMCVPRACVCLCASTMCKHTSIFGLSVHCIGALALKCLT